MMAVTDAREALAAVVAGQLPHDLRSSTLDFKTVGRSRNDTRRSSRGHGMLRQLRGWHRRGRRHRLRQGLGRTGSSCVAMSPARIAAVVAERRGDDWSAEDSGTPLDQVDPVAMAQCRAFLADYRIPDRTVIDHAPTRLAVTSPGAFVTGVTAQNILTT